MVERNARDEAMMTCTECGTDVGLDESHSFSGGGGVTLCWACAVKRGGVFDEKQERWRVPPRTADLPDERRPHA
jgi:hypothetical protein